MEEKKKTVFAGLGQKGYREVWELQERLLEKVKVLPDQKIAWTTFRPACPG